MRDLLENEAGGGEAPPSIVQFGGQTAVNLARRLQLAALPIAGSSAEAIDLAEDRGRFEALVSGLGIPQPPGVAVQTLDQAVPTADTIGYPVLVRPSYVLGGRAMEVVQDESELERLLPGRARGALRPDPDRQVPRRPPRWRWTPSATARPC